MDMIRLKPERKAQLEEHARRGDLSVDEFHAMLDALARGSEKLPSLATESFSRESFY